MDQDFLVSERIDAGANFIRNFNEYVAVTAAFWVNPADSEEWFLYIASDDITDSNFDVAYGEVLRRLDDKERQRLNPFRIKLINSSDPVAREAVKIRDRYAAKIPTRYNGSSLGGMSIGGAYIYEPLSDMKSVR